MTNWLHPGVYAILIGLAAWFALAVWSFAGQGVVDYLLFIVSGFVFVVVALTLILSQVGRRDRGVAGDGKTPVPKVSFVTAVSGLGCGVGYYK